MKNIRYRTVVLASLLTTLLAYYVYAIILPERVTIEVPRNFIIKSNFNFIYEHWKEEKLSRLRDKEDYKDITADTQFSHFLRLCNWVHNQWKHSIPDPYPLSNALDILADIRSGKTGGFCGQYAYVLADVLKSEGFFSVRYVEMWSDKGESHFVVEVWSDEYEKWVVLDPDQNIYFEIESSRIPANAYEIRESLFASRKVIAKKADHPETVVENPGLDLYSHIAVSLRSDLFRHTKWLSIQDRYDMFLFFKDNHTQEKTFQQKKFNNRLPYSHITTRLEDIYYDCNRVRVEYRVEEKERRANFKFFTDSSMANFRSFAISKDQGRHWMFVSDHVSLVEEGKKKIYSLWVTPVNMYQRRGVITKMQITFN